VRNLYVAQERYLITQTISLRTAEKKEKKTLKGINVSHIFRKI